MSKIPFFYPWVGKNYKTGGLFNRKIMILGESYYCGEDCKECGNSEVFDCSQFANDVIKSYIDVNVERKRWMSTFLKFERSLVNHVTSPKESKAIWDSLIFYNYLQFAMHGPRQAGTYEQYKASEEPFFSVLEQYQPDLMIVWGTRLWSHLPGERWEDGQQLLVDNYPIKNGYYRLTSGKKVRTICVYHPSAGYSWDYWYRVINQ